MTRTNATPPSGSIPGSRITRTATALLALCLTAACSSAAGTNGTAASGEGGDTSTASGAALVSPDRPADPAGPAGPAGAAVSGPVDADGPAADLPTGVDARDAASAGGAAALLAERPDGVDTVVIVHPTAKGPEFLTVDGIRTVEAVQQVARDAGHLGGDVRLGWDGEMNALGDPLRPQQWGIDAVGLPHPENSSAGPAEGSGIVVAVVDTGVNAGHPDLVGQVLPGRDFVAGDDDASDEHGHGTLVAGVIAARRDNDIGIAGAAPGAKILPVRVLGTSGSGSSTHVAQGIVWAANNGADVINLSLGSSTRSTATTAAVEYAAQSGVVVVAAAGNGGVGGPVFWPGAEPRALGVAALTSSGAVASFSTRGSYVDVAAPGAQILTTHMGGGYVDAWGTSLAAPFAAALAATVMQRNPAWAEVLVRDALVRGSADVLPAGFDSGAGHGAISYPGTIAAGIWSAPAPANPKVSIAGTDLVVTATAVSYPNVSGYAFTGDDGATITVNRPTLTVKDAATRAGTVRWQVRAAGPAGLLGTPAEISFAVDPPPVPTLTGSAAGATMTLQVGSSPGATGLTVLRNGSPVTTVRTAATVTLANQPLGTHTYTVRATGPAGVSAPSEPVTLVSTLTAPTPTATRTNGDLVITASAVSGAYGYEFERDGVVVARARTNRYLDPGRAQQPGSYRYQVRAYAPDGTNGPTGTVAVDVQPPEAAVVTGAASYGTTVTLHVTVPTGTTRFQVLRDGVAVTEVAARDRLDLTGQPGGTHDYQVRSANGTAIGPPSNTMRVLVEMNAPRNLVVSRTNLDLVVKTDAVPGAWRYEFRRDGVVLAVTGTPRLVDPGRALRAGSYRYDVRALPATGAAGLQAGPYASGGVTVAPPGAADPTITVSGTTVTISVPAVAGATQLLVLRDDKVVGTFSGTATTLRLSSQPTGTRRYQVRGANTHGVGDGPVLDVPVGTSAVIGPIMTTTVPVTSTTTTSDPAALPTGGATRTSAPPTPGTTTTSAPTTTTTQSPPAGTGGS